jgi:hypothetical protein
LALAAEVVRPPGAVALRRIETIRLGQRVLGRNPLRRAGGEPEPDPATWRQLDLELHKAHGRLLYAALLRGPGWLEEHQVRVGGTVWLDMPEMGARGWAKVLALGPCPPIDPGPGQVVAGTFRHEPDDSALDVRVEGLAEPIGVTDTHPFWSEDRQAFVAVGRLRPGERVRTAALGVVAVTSVAHRPREAWVYNLEVHGEHVYQVSPLGLLVHNDNGGRPVFEVDGADPAQREWAENWWQGQQAGRPRVVTYDPEGAAARRTAAQQDVKTVRRYRAKLFANQIGSPDEYPPCSTEECIDPWVGHVSRDAQLNQGGRLQQFIRRHGVKPGDKFEVRIINWPPPP